MPFTFQAPPDTYGRSIAEMIAQRGQQLAQGQAASGQALAQGIQQAGQAAAAVPQQMAQQKTQQQEQQMRQLQIDQATNAQKYQAATNGIIAGLTVQNPDGSRTVDRQKLQNQMASSNIPLAMQKDVLSSLDDVDKSVATFTTAKTDHMADLANSVIKAGATPEAFTVAAALAKANGLATDDQLHPVFDAISNGADVKSLMTQIRGLSEKYKSTPIVVPEGATLATPEGEVLTKGEPKPPTTAELAVKAAAGDATAQDALNKLKPPKTAAETAAEMDAAAQTLYTKRNLGQPLTAEESASLKAYEQRKTVPADATAAAAAARESSSQDFSQKEAGRAALTKNADAPFQTAMQSSSALRDTVAAAQSGNKIAANLQALETTMSAIRSQGLNRINSTELGLPANAGNLWDRVVSGVGKLTSGQPIPADLQKDMLQFADVLDKAAYKKYSDTFDTITKRYKLSDEPKAAAPSPSALPAPNQPMKVGGFTVTVK